MRSEFIDTEIAQGARTGSKWTPFVFSNGGKDLNFEK